MDVNVFVSYPHTNEIHLRTYVNLKSIDMGSDLNFGSVNVDIMKTSCVINLISVITFLGQCGCDWCKCIVNYQCSTHRRYGDTQAGTPLNGVLSRKKKEKEKIE